MKLSKAIKGFYIALLADDYSPVTAKNYRQILSIVCRVLDDPNVETITENDIKTYLLGMKETYTARSVNTHWIAIRSFFNWASGEFEIKKRPDINIKAPKYQDPAVVPFTLDEIQKLVKAAEYAEYKHTDRASYKTRTPEGIRNRAIVLMLLDTGLRVSELARLKRKDVDLETGSVNVHAFGSGKKSRPRVVYLGRNSKKALWSYLNRRGQVELEDRLFVTDENRAMNRDSIRHMITRTAKRAKVSNVYPHRFRHTFAIYYLRNGGDIFTLQRLLGHSTLDMVKHYLAISDSDTELAHKHASPVDRWQL